MKILNIVVLALLVTSCSQINPFVRESADPLIIPPNTLCDPNESLLICTNDNLTDCEGYLKDKPIQIEEIEL